MKASSLISAVEAVLLQGCTLLKTVSPEVYTRRQDGPHGEIENSSVEALFLTENLIQKFRNLPSDSFRHDCTVIYSVGYGESEAQAVRSNVAREVMFCVGHAIHHYAILKMLCMTMAVTLPYEFGVAPSTLKHLEAEAAH